MHSCLVVKGQEFVEVTASLAAASRRSFPILAFKKKFLETIFSWKNIVDTKVQKFEASQNNTAKEQKITIVSWANCIPLGVHPIIAPSASVCVSSMQTSDKHMQQHMMQNKKALQNLTWCKVVIFIMTIEKLFYHHSVRNIQRVLCIWFLFVRQN